MIATLEELNEFRQFAAEQIGNGAEELSLEELVDRWRMLSHSPDELNNNVRAVQEAIADMERGETGQPFEEFAAEFRIRHDLTDSQ
jgi:hypothetical protein